MLELQDTELIKDGEINTTTLNKNSYSNLDAEKVLVKMGKYGKYQVICKILLYL